MENRKKTEAAVTGHRKMPDDVESNLSRRHLHISPV